MFTSLKIPAEENPHRIAPNTVAEHVPNTVAIVANTVAGPEVEVRVEKSGPTVNPEAFQQKSVPGKRKIVMDKKPPATNYALPPFKIDDPAARIITPCAEQSLKVHGNRVGYWRCRRQHGQITLLHAFHLPSHYSFSHIAADVLGSYRRGHALTFTKAPALGLAHDAGLIKGIGAEEREAITDVIERGPDPRHEDLVIV